MDKPIRTFIAVEVGDEMTQALGAAQATLKRTLHYSTFRWLAQPFALLDACARLKATGIAPFGGGVRDGYFGDWYFTNTLIQNLNTPEEFQAAAYRLAAET